MIGAFRLFKPFDNRMRQNATKNRPFSWTKQREDAAELVARDELTNEEISQKVGIDHATLARWKNHPDFQAKVASHVDAFRKAARRRGIAIVENRLDALNDRWQKMRQVIRERAEDPEVAGVPGGTTGLIVKQFKVIGKGESARVIEEYVVDGGILSELRAHEQQAAKELGQWVDRSEVNGSFELVEQAARTLDEKLLPSVESGAAESLSSKLNDG